MIGIIFKCPSTGLSVQTIVSPEDMSRDAFVPVTCAACRRTHFVKPATGEVLGMDGRRG